MKTYAMLPGNPQLAKEGEIVLLDLQMGKLSL